MQSSKKKAQTTLVTDIKPEFSLQVNETSRTKRRTYKKKCKFKLDERKTELIDRYYMI